MEIPHPSSIARRLDIAGILKNKSCFLWGPRQTGKSFLTAQTLKGIQIYDLLDSQVFLDLSRNPKQLGQDRQPGESIVVIDEIQKLPSLMDEVHRLIETKSLRFLLSGSNARKLRRAGTNLLGGRARSRILHPFIYTELKEKFDLVRALNYGLLPPIYFSDAPEDDLKSYCGNYLKEEISAESSVRNLPAFSRFLQVAAACNSQLLNFSKISNDAQVAATTVHEYFQILRDTLIAFDVPAWRKSIKRKPLSTSKFYFFDPGVARFLQNRSWIREKSPEIGGAFETYIAHELKTFLDYRGGAGELCYWRSTSGFEVDFILNDTLAIEVKAKNRVGDQDLSGLRALREEAKLKRYIIVCLERTSRRLDDNTEILPWQTFLDRLWAGDFLS